MHTEAFTGALRVKQISWTCSRLKAYISQPLSSIGSVFSVHINLVSPNGLHAAHVKLVESVNTEKNWYITPQSGHTVHTVDLPQASRLWKFSYRQKNWNMKYTEAFAEALTRRKISTTRIWFKASISHPISYKRVSLLCTYDSCVPKWGTRRTRRERLKRQGREKIDLKKPKLIKMHPLVPSNLIFWIY